MRIREQIYELVKKRPRTASEIIAAIWWVHPQDAPDRSAIKAHVWLLNQQLNGERVVGEWGGMAGRESVYRLVKL